MYSVEGDTVLDPFAGLGTTNLASIASNRNSIGIDIDGEISSLAIDNLMLNIDMLNNVIDARIANHCDFIQSLSEDKRQRCYTNSPHGFFVKTKQETAIKIDRISTYSFDDNLVTCKYE